MQEEKIYLKQLSAIPNIEILINTNWLFINSMARNMNISDVIIRYLVVEEYYQKKDIDEKQIIEQLGKKIDYDSILDLGFPMLALYYQMQYKRSEFIKHISSIDVSSSIYNFLDLIHKVDIEGFNIDYPLEINQNFCLLDGAHRLALALYHQIPKIKVFFNQGLNYTPDYSIDWFKAMNMEKHIFNINNNYKKIIEKNSKSYYLLSDSSIETDDLEKIYFVSINNTLPENLNYEFISKNNNVSKLYVYKLIPKENGETTVYPEYTEKINLPKIINLNEKKLVELCDSNDFVLLKEDDDKNV